VLFQDFEFLSVYDVGRIAEDHSPKIVAPDNDFDVDPVDVVAYVFMPLQVLLDSHISRQLYIDQ
jgi:hypothetical protein